MYCRPHRADGYLDARMTFDELRTVASGLRAAGIARVRLTGGEPLLSPFVVDAVRLLVDLGFDDVALTTNATRLEKLAVPLARAGLHRVNVSLDTLDADRFARLTRGGELAPVLAGLAAAREAGLGPVKLNTVVVRGENDGELEDLVTYAWDHGMVPRFLEIMGIGEGAKLTHLLVPFAEQLARIAHLLEPGASLAREPDRGPARYLRARRDPGLRVGFITGASDTYCDGCDRLRVGADGALRACLARDAATSTAEALRGGAGVDRVIAVRELVRSSWRDKPDGATFRGCTEPEAADVSIRAIGG